jgi:hypothetical protein
MANKNMTPGPDERDEYGTGKQSGTRPDEKGLDRDSDRDFDEEKPLKQPGRITPEEPSGRNQGNR